MPVHVGSVVERVIMGHVFPRLLRFSRVIISPPVLDNHLSSITDRIQFQLLTALLNATFKNVLALHFWFLKVLSFWFLGKIL
jgi:hypothetical protein